MATRGGDPALAIRPLREGLREREDALRKRPMDSVHPLPVPSRGIWRSLSSLHHPVRPEMLSSRWKRRTFCSERAWS